MDQSNKATHSKKSQFLNSSEGVLSQLASYLLSDLPVSRVRIGQVIVLANTLGERLPRVSRSGLFFCSFANQEGAYAERLREFVDNVCLSRLV